MSNFNLDLWRYFRDKYGSDVATIKNQFPELLQDPEIAAAVYAIRNAERAITARLEELDGAPDQDGE